MNNPSRLSIVPFLSFVALGAGASEKAAMRLPGEDDVMLSWSLGPCRAIMDGDAQSQASSGK